MDELREQLRLGAGPQSGVDFAGVRARKSARRRRRLAGRVTAAAAVIALIVGTATLLDREESERVDVGGVPEPASTWDPVAAGPLSPRANAFAFVVENRVLVLGGRAEGLCPPTASCSRPAAEALRDGAVYDPSLNIWDQIADMPATVEYATGAVLGDKLYLLGRSLDDQVSFLAYDVSDDTWEVLPNPPVLGEVVATDRAVVAFATQKDGTAPDSVFDPTSRAWTDLPASPLDPSRERSIVWDGSELVLTSIDLHIDGPNLVRVAALDPTTLEWRVVADTEFLGGMDEWFGVDGRAVNPTLATADGGNNEWGRSYPYGGIVDANGSWSNLPETSQSEGGVKGLSAAGPDMALNEQGLVLGLPSMRWLATPSLPVADAEGRAVVVLDDAVFVWGGVDWSAGGEVSNEGWIWQVRPHANPEDAPSSAPVTELSTTTSAISVPGEPEYDANYLYRWEDSADDPVRLDVLMLRAPGPDFHCAPWPNEIVMGTPLGESQQSTEARIFVRDTIGGFADPAVTPGYDSDTELPPTAVDTGYHRDEMALWMDPADEERIYVVTPDGVESWPRSADHGCA